MAYGSFSYQLSSESSNEARKAAPGKFLRFPARLRQVAVRFLCKAEIVGALDGNFLCHFEDLANDVEENPLKLSSANLSSRINVGRNNDRLSARYPTAARSKALATTCI